MADKEREREREKEKFNPANHLTKVSKMDYLEVKWRLVWFREENPNGHIHTELVEINLEKKFALFKAIVSVPEGGSATAYGSEDSAGFKDYIEKAETKAVGRALGMLGYGTQFTEDFEFSAGNPERIVDAPVSPRPRPGASSPSPSPAASQTNNVRFQNFSALIRSSETIADLESLARESTQKGFTEQEMEELRETYQARKTHLKLAHKAFNTAAPAPAPSPDKVKVPVPAGAAV